MSSSCSSSITSMRFDPEIQALYARTSNTESAQISEYYADRYLHFAPGTATAADELHSRLDVVELVGQATYRQTGRAPRQSQRRYDPVHRAFGCHDPEGVPGVTGGGIGAPRHPAAQEFRRGRRATTKLADFPDVGQTTTVEWQAGQQNFVIIQGGGGATGRSPLLGPPQTGEQALQCTAHFLPGSGAILGMGRRRPPPRSTSPRPDRSTGQGAAGRSPPRPSTPRTPPAGAEGQVWILGGSVGPGLPAHP